MRANESGAAGRVGERPDARRFHCQVPLDLHSPFPHILAFRVHPPFHSLHVSNAGLDGRCHGNTYLTVL